MVISKFMDGSYCTYFMVEVFFFLIQNKEEENWKKEKRKKKELGLRNPQIQKRRKRNG